MIEWQNHEKGVKEGRIRGGSFAGIYEIVAPSDITNS